ncbi:MAG: nuclear transport factor 2 family protein [Candidatus Binataceae bacterium]
MKTLEERVRVLEDIESIKRLKARYCAACDDNYNAEAIAALFTEDAIWDGAGLGKAEGGEKIRQFFRGAPRIFPFAIHHVMNPIIEVEGDSARGQWYLLQPATRMRQSEGKAAEKQAVWLAASYDEQYVRTADGWKFKHLKVTARFLTPYEEGWAKKQFV